MKERETGVYQSTYYLPLVRNYADALLRFKKTKPIRGRTPETRDKYRPNIPTACVPLGRREDVDTYSMRFDEGTGNVEMVCYTRAVLTYTPNHKIIITPNFMGLMESGMIGRMLGETAWLDRRKIGITIGGERHVIASKGSLTLNCEGESLSVDSKEVIYSYYVNRKASNIVRSRYSGFTKYLHGFLQLRKDMERNDLRVNLSEIADCIGYEHKEQGVWHAGQSISRVKVWQPALDHVKHIEHKPQGFRCLALVGTTDNAETLWSAYVSQCNSFMAAIADDQPEGGKVDNYYHMTLTLLALSMPYMHNKPKLGQDMSVDISVSAVERMLDKIVMQWHSDEMLESRPLKPNQLPNDRYDSYVTIMPTEEDVKRLQEERMRVL